MPFHFSASDGGQVSSDAYVFEVAEEVLGVERVGSCEWGDCKEEGSGWTVIWEWDDCEEEGTRNGWGVYRECVDCGEETCRGWGMNKDCDGCGA